jgi:hypothetical protein
LGSDLSLKIVGLRKTQKTKSAALSLHIVTNKLRALLSHSMICGTYFGQILSLFLVYGKYCGLGQITNKLKTLSLFFSVKVLKRMLRNNYMEMESQLNPYQTNTGIQRRNDQFLIMSQQLMENATERLRQNRAMNSTKSPGAPTGAVPVSNVEDISTQLATNSTRVSLTKFILVSNLSITPLAIDPKLEYIENTLGIPIVPKSSEMAIPYTRGSEGATTLGTEYRSDTKNAVMAGPTLGTHFGRKDGKRKWTNNYCWLTSLMNQQINPDRPTHLGRAYSSDPMGDAVGNAPEFPESIQRRLSPEAMSQVPGWSLCTECRIGTWNSRPSVSLAPMQWEASQF